MPLVLGLTLWLGGEALGAPPVRCGDGTIDAKRGEQCDGTNVGNATCESLGFASGVLACGAGCQLDASGCTSQTCAAELEACEGAFSTCDAERDACDGALDTCDAERTVWQNAALACGAELEGTQGLLSTCVAQRDACQGDLSACGAERASCQADLSTCGTALAAAEQCGNAELDDGEDCDGMDLGGARCADVAGAGQYGTLACGAGCQFDTSGCTGDRLVDTKLGTVIDNQTGLEWEKKTDDGSVHDWSNVYAYDGVNGVPAPDGPLFLDFLAKLNSYADCKSAGGPDGPGPVTCAGGCFAGHCDWRIPEIDELQTIVDVIDEPIFGPSADGYWSATTLTSNTDAAWTIDFVAAIAVPTDKFNSENPARAVRGGKARFVETELGTIIDNQTGLEWEKKTNDGTVHDVDNQYTWTAHGVGTAPNGTLFTNFLAGLNNPADCTAGHCDWRVPEIGELRGILTAEFPNCTLSPCIDPIFGPTEAVYWSATSSSSFNAFLIDFSDGSEDVSDKVFPFHARGVRGVSP